ncbi:glycosyltransferase family 2 protein [Paenibacillus senegalimassiliensis]|uniref:glycosyltransferase family 2 protein n=1 Tax=Paenibacillus senegalimassiliensis TaxID=1737426 RepID=UPI00073ED147|nr:glycosyltransferase family 2 protein [Paenibacillus senegalimassiliensis]
MPASPTITVQIVTYNSADDIEDCLRAVQQQTYPVEKVLVIDNVSHDLTVERVQQVMEQEGGQRIELIRNSVNTGFAPAHNQGMRLTHSDYVLVLNPDVQLAPTYIERLVQSIQPHPKLGAATGRLLLKSSLDTIDSTGIVMKGTWRAFDRGMGEPANLWEKSGEVFGVSGAAALYKREMINKIEVGGEFFDEDFFAYKEDVDVAWRASLLGWKAFYCADALAYHERGWKPGSRRAQPLFIRRYSYINRYKMIYKNLTGSRWLKHLPGLLAYELASNGYMLLREPGVLGSWKTFFKTLPKLREKRREIREKMDTSV